jgi:flagella basal body P-ring formation protein FlgA
MNTRKSTRTQEHRSIRIFISCVLMFCFLFCRTSTGTKSNDLQKDSRLQVYLPREVTIKDDIISLGQVSIIWGNPSADELKDKAGKILLGRISVPVQGIIIDRSMILSRLACNGIPASQVLLTGAEKITVRRQHQIIKGSEFVELASAFLKDNPPSGMVCESKPIRIPQDLTISKKNSDIKISPSLAKNITTNQAKVIISVVEDGNQIDEREVTFRLKFKCRRAVTLVDIPAGTVISPANVKIEDAVSNEPEPANWKPPYGQITKRPLSANTVLGPNMFGPVKPEAVIKRNQNVIIRIERPLLLVTAVGKAMQEGRVGEYIRVRNVNSQRIILARVKEDGTVEPVF